LSLGKLGPKLHLAVQDNGRGFDQSDVLSPEVPRKGLGLISMRERAEFSGGSLDIDSAEGKGTIIRASWDLSQYRSEGTDPKVFYSSLGRVN